MHGPDPQAESLRAFLLADPARANIAELGLGCNERAVVQGNVLEDDPDFIAPVESPPPAG